MKKFTVFSIIFNEILCITCIIIESLLLKGDINLDCFYVHYTPYEQLNLHFIYIENYIFLLYSYTNKDCACSITERLFGLNQESYNAYSYLKERPNDCLLKAAKSGDLRTVKELHNQGYSLLTKDEAGQTMLHHAARYGHKDIVKYCIRFAPSLLNEKDSNLSQTALHKAVAYKWRSICCILVAGGAALDVTDHRGLTPRLLAVQNDEHDLAAYLESQENFQVVSSDLGTVV